MPVHPAVITSKRARRGRFSHESSPVQESYDTKRLREKLREAADSQTNRSKANTQLQSSLASTTSVPSSSSVNMSTWQVSGIAPVSGGMSMPQNTSNENGTNSPPKSPRSPAKGNDQLSGVELSFKKRRSFSKSFSIYSVSTVPV